jgi:hypothetical protein
MGSLAVKFSRHGTPGSILTIMGALCLFALSAVLMELLRLVSALIGSDAGGWHGVSLWFLIMVGVPYALGMIAAAVLVVSAPFALAMLVNNKSARTPQNLIVTAVGVLFAIGCVVRMLSRITM